MALAIGVFELSRQKPLAVSAACADPRPAPIEAAAQMSSKSDARFRAANAVNATSLRMVDARISCDCHAFARVKTGFQFRCGRDHAADRAIRPIAHHRTMTASLVSESRAAAQLFQRMIPLDSHLEWPGRRDKTGFEGYRIDDISSKFSKHEAEYILMFISQKKDARYTSRHPERPGDRNDDNSHSR